MMDVSSLDLYILREELSDQEETDVYRITRGYMKRRSFFIISANENAY